MKKRIVFGIFLAVFLMLMMPVNSVGQNQSIDEKLDNCSICHAEEKIKNEKLISFIFNNKKLNGFSNDCVACIALVWITGLGFVYMITIWIFAVIVAEAEGMPLKYTIPCVKLCEDF